MNDPNAVVIWTDHETGKRMAALTEVEWHLKESCEIGINRHVFAIYKVDDNQAATMALTPGCDPLSLIEPNPNNFTHPGDFKRASRRYRASRHYRIRSQHGFMCECDECNWGLKSTQ